MKKGKVKFYNGKMGFIEVNNFDDVHIGPDSFSGKSPNDGDMVTFDIVNQGQGPHAINLKIMDNEMIEFFKENVLTLDANDEKYDKFCDISRDYAERLSNNDVTTSMIRKIYSRILNANSLSDIKVLRPQFAYTSGRNEKNKVLKEFMDLLDFLA